MRTSPCPAPQQRDPVWRGVRNRPRRAGATRRSHGFPTRLHPSLHPDGVGPHRCRKGEVEVLDRREQRIHSLDGGHRVRATALVALARMQDPSVFRAGLGMVFGRISLVVPRPLFTGCMLCERLLGLGRDRFALHGEDVAKSRAEIEAIGLRPQTQPDHEFFPGEWKRQSPGGHQ